MALKRMGSLTFLMMPLGVLVPMNWVVGGGGGKEEGRNRWKEGLMKWTWDYALWAVGEDVGFCVLEFFVVLMMMMMMNARLVMNFEMHGVLL
jgi:hypothetical protein